MKISINGIERLCGECIWCNVDYSIVLEDHLKRCKRRPKELRSLK